MWCSVVPLALPCLPPTNDNSSFERDSQEHQPVLSAWEESPTAYRLGLGSPTRLVRFGFSCEMESSISLSTVPGVWESASPSCADSSVLFLRRPRLGGAETGETSGEAS
jgi:hypothetical protein